MGVMDSLFIKINHNDIIKIKEIYNSILTEYARLNNNFNFYDPVEIYSMFCFCYNNGYLSHNKKIKNNINIHNINPILGTNIIMDSADYKSTAVMLKDIFNKLRMESNLLPVYINHFEEKISMTEIEYGNHIINIVVKNNIVYFLDPINQHMYKLNDYNKEFLYNPYDSIIKICYPSLKKIENNTSKIKKNIYLPSTHITDDNQIYSNTLRFCENNIDFFENYYQQNKEKYDDIYSKIMTLKNKRI